VLIESWPVDCASAEATSAPRTVIVENMLL